jgi:hypothetical protein
MENTNGGKMNNLIELLSTNVNEVKSFFAKQESAPTVEMFGPTNSTKSTIITELLEPASNKLLSYNVGNTAQTTLIRLVLMLNSRMNSGDVIIRCLPYKDRETLFLVMLFEIMKELNRAIYDERDDLESFKIDEKVIRNMLNPTSRSYHCYEYVSANQAIYERFMRLVEKTVLHIINEPKLLSVEADIEYDDHKKSNNKLKKKEIYEELIDKRFHSDETIRESLYEWYQEVLDMLLREFASEWNHIVKDKDGTVIEYIVGGKISETDSGVIGKIVRAVYDENSAYSLVFEEVNYVTAPSSSFTASYNDYMKSRNLGHFGRKLKINIIDTMGITQVSTEKDDISNEMDKLFQRPTDAYLFLCATDERPSTYDDCISLLLSKKKKYENKVFMICRTKADVILRNAMRNNWSIDTGKNDVDEDKYSEYLSRAFEQFKHEQLECSADKRAEEYKICNGLPIQFLCMDSDRSGKMREKFFTNGELDSSKVFYILFDMMEEIDKKYVGNNNRLWLYSNDLNHRPLNIVSSSIALGTTVSNALVTCNMQQKNQYMQYNRTDIVYHWNSVYCFYNKLSLGEGHETRAEVYGSFKLYIKNMVESWIKKEIPKDDVLRDIQISYDYLDTTEIDAEKLEKMKAWFNKKLREIISLNWNQILSRIAKQLSYDCLQPELRNVYSCYYYDSAFKKSLELFNSKFSTNAYWEQYLQILINKECNNILQKMYVFDEV